MNDRQRHVTGTAVALIACLIVGFLIGAFLPVFRASYLLWKFSHATEETLLREQAVALVQGRSTMAYMRPQLDDFVSRNGAGLDQQKWHSLVLAALRQNDEEFLDVLLAGMSTAGVSHATMLRPFGPQLKSLPITAKLAILTWLDYEKRRELEASRSNLVSRIDAVLEEELGHVQ
jgi:hypothetical protein